MAVDNKLRAIIDRFAFPGEMTFCREIVTGHINRTYELDFRRSDGQVCKYVLQRINNYVFKKPEEVMENIGKVTEHLNRSMTRRGIDPVGRVLRLIPTRDGGTMVIDDAQGFWRAYDYIRHAVTIDRVQSPEQFREIGRAFGEFQNMLSDFPIEQLHETIPQFHDTRKRLGDFERSVALDVASRAASVGPEIEFIRRRGPEMCQIVEWIESGEIPLRVTHNDTKINNVMLDEGSGQALCVIDLDTVMPGSALYDFGDAIRYGACTAAEDERDLSKVALDIDLFSGFSEGFIAQTADILNRTESENLPLGAMVMTYENALRFLADYLDGDIYYRIEEPDQNLARARCQSRLLSDMEAKREDMFRITRQLMEKYRAESR